MTFNFPSWQHQGDVSRSSEMVTLPFLPRMSTIYLIRLALEQNGMINLVAVGLASLMLLRSKPSRNYLEKLLFVTVQSYSSKLVFPMIEIKVGQKFSQSAPNSLAVCHKSVGL